MGEGLCQLSAPHIVSAGSTISFCNGFHFQEDICDTIKTYATPMLYNRHVFYFNMTSR